MDSNNYETNIDIPGSQETDSLLETLLMAPLVSVGIFVGGACMLGVALANKGIQEARRNYHMSRGRAVERVDHEESLFFHYRVKYNLRKSI